MKNAMNFPNNLIVTIETNSISFLPYFILSYNFLIFTRYIIFIFVLIECTAKILDHRTTYVHLLINHYAESFVQLLK